MAAVLHGAPARRRVFEPSSKRRKRATRALAARYGLNPKTVAQVAQADHDRRRADGAEDAAEHGADAGRGGHRRRVPATTLLPLDDVLGCLRETHPQALSRSALHRCLQRHGISRLPEARRRRPSASASPRPTRSATSTSTVCELRHADGKLIMFLAIDRVSKFTYVEFHDSAGKMEGAAFLRERRGGLPLPDPHRAHRQRHGLCRPAQEPRTAPSRGFLGGHIFDRVCIEQRHRAPADQALPPLDQRPGRADEPHDQGRHRQGLPLRRPGKPQGPCPGLRHRLQLRQAPQGAEDGGPPSRPSARPGPRTRQSSKSTRTTSSRDHTPRQQHQVTLHSHIGRRIKIGCSQN